MYWSDVVAVAQKCASKKSLSIAEETIVYAFSKVINHPEKQDEIVDDLNRTLGL